MSLTQINKAGLDELALDHVFTIGASGNDHYTFQGEGLNGTVNDPTLYLTRGKTYRFENGSGGHPIRIQSTSGASGTAYNTGVTNNAGSGTVIVEVQHDAPDVLYYQCTSHAAMNGILYITGALADGGVTTAKIAADAVTGAKIADDAINSEHYTDGSIDTAHIADGAVTTGKIANEAVTLNKLPHGDGSSDGKFLRANNGADPSFETVTSTTINNNADNRVITGSGTANTLNGEANLTYNSTMLTITGSNEADLLQLGTGNHGGNTFAGIRGDNEAGIRIRGGGSERGGEIDLGGGTRNTDPATIKFSTNTSTSFQERMRITSSGEVGINVTDPEAYGANGNGYAGLTVEAPSGNYSGITIRSNYAGTGSLQFADGSGSTAERRNGFIDCDHVNKRLNIGIEGSSKIRITENGFHPNPGDSAAANALDDYEEGQYVPTMYGQSGTTSFDLHSGESKVSYQKVGNTVTIHGRIRINNNNFSGAAYMTLPFTAAANDDTDNAGSSAIAVHGVDYGGSRRTLFLETGGNTAYVWFLIVRDNASWLSATSSNLLSNSYLSFVHSYKAA